MTEGPIVIGHRGASGYRPEHTLASYRLAIEMGADFIEPDLVATRDGEVVARHEPEISATTDVAIHPEFVDRWTTKVIDGSAVSGWFTDDFTLAELRTLRAVERIPDLRPDNATYDGRELIPTFEEVVALARAAGVGLYPETKHPAYFRTAGLPLEEEMLAVLRRAGYTGRSDPVFLQSFEDGNLRALRRMTDLRLVRLLAVTQGAFDLADVATYADGIGPAKTLVIPQDDVGRSLAPTSLVSEAHDAGLFVHPWTFRRENAFLPLELWRGADEGAAGDLDAELASFFDLGVDGVFTDNPDIAIAARAGWKMARR